MNTSTPPTLLIVEDDWEFYQHLSHLLLEQNYEVCAYAPTYEEGLALFQAEKPQAILMDIELQGVLNGLQLAQEIRKTSHVPIIYLSNIESNSVLDAASLTSANDYLIKGKISDLKQVLATLKMVLSQPQLNKESGIQEKEGVMGMIGYKQNLPLSDKKQVHTIPVPFEQILFFSTDEWEVKKGNVIEKVKVQENYCWFATRDSKVTEVTNYRILMLETSLSALMKQLPDSFERINQKTIVNLSMDCFEGLVNGFGSILKPEENAASFKQPIHTEESDAKRMHLKVAGKIFVVSETYRKRVEEKLKKMYLRF